MPKLSAILAAALLIPAPPALPAQHQTHASAPRAPGSVAKATAKPVVKNRQTGGPARPVGGINGAVISPSNPDEGRTSGGGM